MKFIKYSVSFVLFVIVASACTKDPDVGATSTVEMAGEWWVKRYLNNAAVTGYEKMLSFNTSDPNSGQVWVDNTHDALPFKAKFDVDYANLAFKAMASTPNTVVNGATVKVLEGKILKGAGKSLTGHPVDSIFIRVELSNSAGNVYELKGHYDTGFFEDHP